MPDPTPLWAALASASPLPGLWGQDGSSAERRGEGRNKAVAFVHLVKKM